MNVSTLHASRLWISYLYSIRFFLFYPIDLLWLIFFFHITSLPRLLTAPSSYCPVFLLSSLLTASFHCSFFTLSVGFSSAFHHTPCFPYPRIGCCWRVIQAEVAGVSHSRKHNQDIEVSGKRAPQLMQWAIQQWFIGRHDTSHPHTCCFWHLTAIEHKAFQLVHFIYD